MIQRTDDALLIETGRMSSRLIHDFKNQLGGIKLYASYLKKRFADNPEGVEIADKIIQSLNDMAEQAALVAKLARPVELRREKADLGQLVETVVSGLKPRAEAVQVTLRATLESRLVGSVDAQQLQTALGSIIGRAISATPQNGEVKIVLRPARNGVSDATSEGEAVEIEIRDQGEPPDENRLRTFFDPLTNERINQASLGLALARRIIEIHGGDIRVTQGSPEGAVVQVKLII